MGIGMGICDDYGWIEGFPGIKTEIGGDGGDDEDDDGDE